MPTETETELLKRSLRHCCLCYYHERIRSVRRGQIAHLNRDRCDDHLNNLVWLCLDHHAEYDSRSHQSKGWTPHEVRHFRNLMYAHFERLNADEAASPVEEAAIAKDAGAPRVATVSDKVGRKGSMWRFPLWQIADRPEFFAYSSNGNADGICVIERVDLPDGRIVVCCVQVPGNPGTSITNTVETICEQVCERFEIPFDRLVWLENYDFGPVRWDRVTFSPMTAEGRVSDPVWEPLTDADWEELGLRPRERLGSDHSDLVSKLDKLFPWPPQDHMLG